MHGIQQTDTIALNRVKAWHGLGTVVQEDMSPAQALQITGLDWPVEMVPAGKFTDSTGRICVTDTEQALVRMDTGEILKVHGGSYSPLQNDQLFNIAYALGGQVKVETAGSLFGGRQIFCLLRGETLNLKNNDENIPYLALINSHDGSRQFAAVPTTVRVVCNNTLSLMLQTSKKRMYTVRHSGDIDVKIEDMKKNLLKFQADTSAWVNKATALQGKTLNHTEAVIFWGSVYEKLWKRPVTEEEQLSAAAVIQGWEVKMETERAELGAPDVNLWLLANAVTNDIQHSDPIRKRDNWGERRLESNWFGEKANDSVMVFNHALATL